MAAIGVPWQQRIFITATNTPMSRPIASGFAGAQFNL